MPGELSRGLRVLVLDDHAIVVEGVRSVLGAHGHAVVASSTSVSEAIDLFGASQPDVVLCEIDLPDGSGLELVRKSRERAIPAIVFSEHDEPMCVFEAVRAGAKGYLLKSDPASSVLEGVEAVARGNTHFSKGASAVLSGAPTSDVPGQASHGLTRREVEVLRCVANGRTTRQIGVDLQISPRTVETHRERLMAKLGVNNAAGLTRMAIKLGVASTAEPAPSHAT